MSILATLTEGLALVNELISLRSGPAEARRRVRPLVRALREIYFVPRSTRAVLEAYASDRQPDEETLAAVLTDFNDREWNIRRRAELMDFRDLGHFGINLRQRRTLDQIAYDKIDLRRELQELFNVDDILERGIDGHEARDLLERIQTLNTAIEQMEEELL